MVEIDRSALLFRLSETSYLVGFTYAAVTAAITTGIVLEYRILNPFGTYVEAEGIGLRVDRKLYVGDVLQTCTVAFVSTMFVLVFLHLCFAMGGAMVVNR